MKIFHLNLHFAFAFCISRPKNQWPSLLHIGLDPKKNFQKNLDRQTDTQQRQRHTQNQWPSLLHNGLDRNIFYSDLLEGEEQHRMTELDSLTDRVKEMRLVHQREKNQLEQARDQLTRTESRRRDEIEERRRRRKEEREAVGA